MPPHIPWIAYACLSASMVLVGTYVGLTRLLVSVFPVLLLAWLRFALAAAAMAHWTPRRADEPPLSGQDRKRLFLGSLLGNFMFSICMLYGVAATSALAAGVTMAALPAAVALLSRAVDRTPLRPRVLAGIACAVVGIALLTMVRSGTRTGPSADSAWGYLLLVGAVFCEASYVVIGKRLTAQVSPRRISALFNLWGLALMTPFGVWHALRFDFGSVTMPQWGLLLFYALAASMVSVWLWMQGLRKVPAAQAGVFTIWLPISAAAVGVLFLGEVWRPVHLIALALALLGLLLAVWPERAAASHAVGT